MPRMQMIQRNRQKQTTRLSPRLIIAVSGASLTVIIAAVLFIPGFFSNTDTNAAANGDYRSVQSGNWNATSTWQKYNGSAWIAATATPTNSDGAINIRNGHTVTVTTGVSVDQVTVDAGGFLAQSNGVFTVEDGNGDDLTVNGTINISKTITMKNDAALQVNGLVVLQNGGSLNMQGNSIISINNGGRYRKDGGSQDNNSKHWIIGTGGTYQHNDNGTNLPNIPWVSGSNCEITGMTTQLPSNLDQSFYNLTWNSPGQTMKRNIGSALNVINGDFRMISTGTGSIQLNQSSNQSLDIAGNYYHEGGTLYVTEGGGWTINITGNFIQTGGSLVLTDGASSQGAGTPVMNVTGNFSISGGIFDMSQYTGSNTNNGFGTLNMYGDFSFTGGAITETSTGVGRGIINFMKSGTQSVTSGGTISNSVDFIVSTNSTLNLGTSVLTGTGNFSLVNNGGLILGSANGITSSGASGNVQVTGTRTYSTSGRYTYSGGSSQSTGNGLPATVNSLTIDNASGVTLTGNAAASSSLLLTSGILSTGANTLTLGTSVSATGTLNRTSGFVTGNFRRWIAAAATSNIVFPVGTTSNYNGLTVSFTGAPSAGGTLASAFTSSNPGNATLPLNDAGSIITNVGTAGYWEMVPANGLTGGTYSIDIEGNGFTGINDYVSLRVLFRTNASASWSLRGTHAAGSGSNSNPVVRRTAVTGWGQIGIGGGVSNPLPIKLVSFTGESDDRAIILKWKTAAEQNNDFFTIEKSSDGKIFSELIRIPGAGNTSVAKNYSTADDNPINGTNFYRLRQTDFNGKSTLSKIISVHFTTDELKKEIRIQTVRPNPFTEYFSVDFYSPQPGDVEIALIELSGKIVYKEKYFAQEGNNSFQFNDGQRLKTGYYSVVITDNASVVSEKIVKK